MEVGEHEERTYNTHVPCVRLLIVSNVYALFLKTCLLVIEYTMVIQQINNHYNKCCLLQLTITICMYLVANDDQSYVFVHFFQGVNFELVPRDGCNGPFHEHQ